MEVRLLSGAVIQLGANEFQGTVKELKQILAAQVGVSRFRLKLFLDQLEIMDDKILEYKPVEPILVVMDFCPADDEDRQQMLLAITQNDLDSLEDILQHGYDPNMTCLVHDDIFHEDDEEEPLQIAAAQGHLECIQLLIEAGAELPGCVMLCPKIGDGPIIVRAISMAKMMIHHESGESGVPNFQSIFEISIGTKWDDFSPMITRIPSFRERNHHKDRFFIEWPSSLAFGCHERSLACRPLFARSWGFPRSG